MLQYLLEMGEDEDSAESRRVAASHEGKEEVRK